MTESDYVYHEPTGGPVGGPLPAGEYDFTVADIPTDPYRNKASGNFVLPVKLHVGPDKVTVYDNPSAGVTKTGKPYDNIAAFLKAIGRAPGDGQRPNLSRIYLTGATGRVMLKVEKATQGALAGKDVNRVYFYIWNREPGGALVPAAAAHGQVDPENIPF